MPFLASFAAYRQHHTLMAALDFRLRNRVMEFGQVLSVFIWIGLVVVGLLNWLSDAGSGARFWLLELPLAVALAAFVLEIVLVIILQILAGRFVAVRQRLFRQMMHLRADHPFLLQVARSKALTGRFFLRVQVRSAFLGLFVSGSVVLALLTRVF